MDQPASLLYRHQLNSVLESVIRYSNAQFEPEYVRKRLDARVLELVHGDLGWDVFTLEYKLDGPLEVIATAYAKRQYLKLFNFLWRIKRVEYALTEVYLNATTSARTIMKDLERENGDSEVFKQLHDTWQKARLLCTEMVQFISQLQCYILFEVIESSWVDFMKDVENPSCNLNTIIQAHEKFLSNITHKGLLGSGKTVSEESFVSQLHEMLKRILQFKNNSVRGFLSLSLSYFCTYNI